jgi:hypothetical protein
LARGGRRHRAREQRHQHPARLDEWAGAARRRPTVLLDQVQNQEGSQ